MLSALAATKRPDQMIVGFAAEHGADALAYGREKLDRKLLDAVAVNDISRPDIGFDVAENEVVIVSARSERRVPRMSKERVADEVIDEVERLRGGREARDAAAPAGARSAARV